jgi:hypothetical protein
MSMSDQDASLKAYLFEAMRGPGGVPDFLYRLRDLMREMAQDQREVVRDERLAKVWEEVARIIGRAADKSIPLLPIL